MERIQVDILGLSTSPSAGGAYALILKEVSGARRLPIIIGAFEAQSIALELEGIKPPRPLTHDLIKNLIDTMGVGIHDVYINELKDGTFYARISFDSQEIEELLSKLSAKLDGTGGATGRAPLKWIQASVGQQLRKIPVGDVLFFTSDEKYTRVQTEGFEALIQKPIKELVDELDPEQFWQIHRSTIVNVNAIASLSQDFRGHLVARLKTRTETLPVSQPFAHLFRQM